MSLVSNFIGPAATMLSRPDKRACDEWFHSGDDLWQPPALMERQPIDDGLWEGFATPFWPASGSILGGASSLDGTDGVLCVSKRWSEPWLVSGCNGRLGFVGYTRDAYGSPVGGCTVRCFNTATNELVSMVTSDSEGYYIATTPHADGHYLVVHKSGSPEIAGASVSSLLPG